MDREGLVTDLARVAAELEARFGRPLTDEERAHLQDALPAAAAAAAATTPDAASPAAQPAAHDPGYGSVRRTHDADRPTPGAARPTPGAARPTPGVARPTPGAAAGPIASPGAPAAAPSRARTGLGRIFGPIVAGGLAVAKWSAIIFKLKFLGLFLSIGAFQFLWRSWWIAIGFFVLIFIHEVGHMLEARRQGLAVSWPQFVPFLGAYVTLKELPANAWRSALISIAGPALGSVAAVGCWIAADATGSVTLKALAHIGLFINLINLIPIGFLDGGKIADALDPMVWLGVLALLGIVAALLHNGLIIIVLIVSAVEVWSRWKHLDARRKNPYYAIGMTRMGTVAIAYVGLAALLVVGMEATNIPR